MATKQKLPQHLAALEEANRVRLAGANWKKKVARTHPRRAYVVVAQALEKNDAAIRSMKVERVLTSISGVGPERARRYLQRAFVNPIRRTGEISKRQRQELARSVREAGRTRSVREKSRR